MTTLFVEQLTVIDASYLCPRRGLVGESWIVDLELEGALDEQSMVLDFGAVKKQLKRAIDDGPDHTLIVPLHYPGQQTSPLPDGRLQTLFMSRAGGYQHSAPACALTLLEAPEVTTEALIAHLTPQLAAVVPANVAGIRLSLRHEQIDGASYHYTHGLSKHLGACQRIAHGHRSRIAILVDGIRDAALEASWAETFRDIYLVTGRHLLQDDGERLRLAYTAPEGRFELEVPKARSYLLGQDTDSTVEEIAEHLADRIAAERPGGRIEVRAYEGVMKGALARR
ncbi:MAG: 6-carboxytetrahydropterin synthase [Stagnimonas sp.]|nr:6-carboxytetrahydropterin synthase [Stagnimonas sp.]